VETEGSLPHLQAPANCLFPEPDQSSTCPHIRIPEIHLIIILPSMPEFSKRSAPFRCKHQHSVCTSPLSERATCSIHLILLDFINRIILGENYRSLSSSLCIFLYNPPPVATALLGRNSLLSTLFSKAPSVHSSLNMSDHVSHPYGITDIIIFWSIPLHSHVSITPLITPAVWTIFINPLNA